MDPLQVNDDDDLNFEKKEIHQRLNRLIEKQTKRYETLISSGNHGDAQRLLQIIWQLKQLRLPGADEEIALEHSIPPGKLAPILEPFLKSSLNESQLDLLFEKKPAEPMPPMVEMTPSMPDLLKFSAPIVNDAPTQILSPAPASMPSIPPPTIPPPSIPSPRVSFSNMVPPNMVPQVQEQVPTPSPPISNPLNINLLQEPIGPPPAAIDAPTTPAVSPSFDRNEFDEISSGEFDIAGTSLDEEENSVSLQRITGEIERPKFMQPASDFEDESSKYDDWEANQPLRGLTTSHVPVVKSEDLIDYRKEVRDTIAWEEEEEIAPVMAPRKPKTYLREKVKIKSAKHVDQSDDDNLDELYEEVDFTPKGAPSKKLILAAGIAASIAIGLLCVFAFVSMSAPKFEELEKMGQQSDKSPYEMEQLYAKASKANPNDVRGWSGLSYWQSRQGQVMPALESQAKAIKLKPKDAKQWYSLALLLKESSNFKESLRAANEAVALEPLNTQYLGLQEKVQDYNP